MQELGQVILGRPRRAAGNLVPDLEFLKISGMSMDGTFSGSRTITRACVVEPTHVETFMCVRSESGYGELF